IAFVEGAVISLVLKDRIPWLAGIDLAATLYGVLWLLGLALAPHVYPHRLKDRSLEVHLGFLYSARIPLETILEAKHGRIVEGWRSECVTRDGTAYLRVDGRTDIALPLSSPCELERPFSRAESIETVHVAVDDWQSMLRAL